METITLCRINKNKNVIHFVFEISEGIQKFFSDKPFLIEYPENIEAVPDAIAAVPFVCNVLPIVWLTDSKLFVPELDEAFYNCIPEVKKGYEDMYPETEFRGEIEAGRIVPCDRPAIPGKCALFYSGGVDSMATLYRHLSEQPLLISIWGSDIKYDNEKGWNRLHFAIEETASHYSLEERVIHSTFREFDCEGMLDRAFHSKLQDSWWHGVKHGIALLGHVAPFSYVYGLETMYIASSFCPEDKMVRCASDPRIDNHVRFANCSVVHDGFEWSRQDKIHHIVEHSKSKNDYHPLHVCWKTQTGTNCCHCEKCYRTIAAILAEGEDPEKLGFRGFQQFLDGMIETVVSQNDGGTERLWTKIQRAVKNNKQSLKFGPYWASIRWIEKADFEHPERIQEPLVVRLKKAKGIRGKLGECAFYQKLHERKVNHK